MASLPFLSLSGELKGLTAPSGMQPFFASTKESMSREQRRSLCPFPTLSPSPLLPSLSVFSSFSVFLCRGHCALEQRCQESHALSLFTLLLFHLAFHLRVCQRICLFKQNLVYISTQDVYFGSVWPKLDIFFSLEVFLQLRALLSWWSFRNSLKTHFSN